MAQSGVLIEGTEYTRAGGTYTFDPAWVGVEVEIEYQTQDLALTTSALAALGLDLATGTFGQPVWSHLSTRHPGEAIGYSGLAYVYAPTYALDDGARVENHTFEVSTPSEFSAAIVDANMARVVEEFLTDGLRGCKWPAARLAGLSAYSDYCIAHGLFMSPALLEQQPAAEVLARWFQLTNADAVMSGRQLKIVPLGDENKTGNGVTYIANVTPVYDLTPSDFIADDGEPRVRVEPLVNEDAYNHVRIEYQNRANDYNVEIVSAKDAAHIEQYGERVMEVIKAHEIKTGAVAQFAAQMELQRQMAVWNRYRFKLPWTKGRLEPTDLVTLTDPDQYLDRVPVRIKRMSEAGLEFDVEAEDAPIGHASAPLYGAQAGSGFAPDYNAAPGNALAPVVFELPGVLTVSGLGLAVATTGGSDLWGGCQVWASYDGVSYQQIGEINGGSRYGALTAPIGSAAAVELRTGQLLGGTAADAEALATLCYVGGDAPEYFAYESATLLTVRQYALGGLVRGAYGSEAAAHAVADPFVRVDGAVVRSGPLDPALVGKTVYIKLTSFNVFGGGQQSLADVPAHAYGITGQFIVASGGGSSFSLQSTAQAFSFSGAGVAVPAAQTITFKAVLGGAAGSPVFTCTRYNASNVSLGTVELPGAGNVRTLPVALFGAAAYCVVLCKLGDLEDQCTIQRLRDGADSINGYLTNEADTVSTASDGSGGVYTDAGGVFRVFDGLVDKTGTVAVAYSIAASAGIVGLAINAAGVYTLTGTSEDKGTATLRAIYAGVTIDKIYSIARSKGGTRGLDGEGRVSARVLIYRRSASGIPSLPSALATLTFSTGAITGLNNGWSIDIPAGTDPVYVSAATASAAYIGSGTTATIAAVSWAGATLMMSNGAAGLNNATVQVYRRTTTAVAPAGIAGTTTYTFATGLLTGALGAWYQIAPPASDGKYLWTQIATALGTTATDDIPAGEWSAVRLHVQDGETGASQYTLVPRGSAFVAGGTVSKPSGAAAWDSDANSVEAYVGAAYMSFRCGELAGNTLIGFSMNPTSMTHYDAINYGWNTGGGGVCSIYESGGHAGSFGAITAATVLSGIYDGKEVRYYKDGVLQRTVAVAAGVRFYLKASLFTPGSSLNSIAFGPSGPAGFNALQLALSPPAASVLADSSGNVVSGGLTQAVTTAKVTDGQTDVTSLWTITRTNGTGITSSISGATITVTGMTVDVGEVIVTATRAGYATQTARLVLTKVRSAAPTSGPVPQLYAYATGVNASSGSPAIAAIRIETNGQVSVRNGPSTVFNVVAEWYTPPTTNVGSSPGYWVKSVSIDGAAAGGAFNVLTKLTSAITFALTASGGASLSAQTKHTFYSDAAGTMIVGVLYCDFTADHVG